MSGAIQVIGTGLSPRAVNRGLQHPDGAHTPSFDAVAGAIKTGCAG